MWWHIALLQFFGLFLIPYEEFQLIIQFMLMLSLVREFTNGEYPLIPLS